MITKTLVRFSTFVFLLSVLQSCAEKEFNSIEQATNSRDDNGAKTGRWVEYVDMNGNIEDFYQDGVSERFRLITYNQGCPVDAIKEYQLTDSSLFSSYAVKCKSPALLGRPLEEIRDTTYFYESNRLSSIKFDGARGSFEERFHYRDSSVSLYDSSTVLFISTEILPIYRELYTSIPWDILNGHIDAEDKNKVDNSVRTSMFRIYYDNGDSDTSADLLEGVIVTNLTSILSEAKQVEREIKNNPLYQSITCDCCNKRIRQLRDAYVTSGSGGILQLKRDNFALKALDVYFGFRQLGVQVFFCSWRCAEKCG